MERRRFLQALGLAVPAVAFFDMGAAWAKRGDSILYSQWLPRPHTELQLMQGYKLIMSADLREVPALMDGDELTVTFNSNGMLSLDAETKIWGGLAKQYRAGRMMPGLTDWLGDG